MKQETFPILARRCNDRENLKLWREPAMNEKELIKTCNQVYPMGIEGMQEHLKATKSTYPD